MVVKAADDTPAAPEGAKKEKKAKKDAPRQAEGVTITGRVTNLKAVRPYMSEESYVQLIALPSGKHLSIGGTIDAEGWVTWKSDLAKSPISSNGRFRLHASELTPGSYLVIIQKMIQRELYHLLLPMGLPCLGKAQEKWTIGISSDTKLPLVIDGGDVELLMME